jgi:hypothetical protein
MALQTIDENARTSAVFVNKTHGDVTWDNANSNSVDKVMDKDPVNQHEDAVKGQKDKLEETVAGLNSRLSSDSKHIFKLVAEKVVLQPLYSNVVAQLAFIIEVFEEEKALDIEKISLLEERDKKISGEIEKLKRSLDARQQLLDVSTRLLVCVCFSMPCHSPIARNSLSLFVHVLSQNGFSEVAVDRNATTTKPDAAIGGGNYQTFRIEKVNGGCLRRI